jgi:hypothetical protein
MVCFLDCIKSGITELTITRQYAIFYKGQGPFTSVDIEVLESAKNPELLLYTWNNDPRTSAVGNKALQDHRLGIYDWVQKCHVVVVWSLMNGLYDLALVAEDILNAKFPQRKKKETSIGSPSGLTYVPQIMNSLFEMIGPIAQYPFTQVSL